jgi:hypothetical protein
MVRGIATVEKCESLCIADSACAGYTYNVKRSTCIPKTAIGPLSPAADPAVTGIVERRTGSAHAEDTASSNGGKVTCYPNMDAPGSDAKWVRGVASVEQCENLCIADSACAGYTYNIKQSAIAAVASGAQSLISTGPSKYSISFICQRYGMPRWNHCRIVPGRAPSFRAPARRMRA